MPGLKEGISKLGIQIKKAAVPKRSAMDEQGNGYRKPEEKLAIAPELTLAPPAPAWVRLGLHRRWPANQ
jgi:hypothetical protein